MCCSMPLIRHSCSLVWQNFETTSNPRDTLYKATRANEPRASATNSYDVSDAQNKQKLSSICIKPPRFLFKACCWVHLRQQSLMIQQEAKVWCCIKQNPAMTMTANGAAGSQQATTLCQLLQKCCEVVAHSPHVRAFLFALFAGHSTCLPFLRLFLITRLPPTVRRLALKPDVRVLRLLYTTTQLGTDAAASTATTSMT